MRVLGLNLVIALALFGVAYTNSDRQEVVDAYRTYIRGVALQDVRQVCKITGPNGFGREPGESIEQVVDRCAREVSEGGYGPSAEDAAKWSPLLDAQVVDITFSGSLATASLRIDGCTIPVLQLVFERGEGKDWYLHGSQSDDRNGLPVCEEGGQIPPPELAWTWEERQWR